MSEPIESFLKDVVRPEGFVELNAGTLSATPAPIFNAAERLRRMQSSAPSDFYFNQIPARLPSAREALGRFLNARPADLFLLPNVTQALNVAIQSMPLKAGDEIVTTDHEYGAMANLLHATASRSGARVVVARLPTTIESPAQIVGAVARAMGKHTRAMFCSHVSSPSGLVMPAKALATLARSRGVMSFVDGAHAPGMLPVDLTDIDADVYGANLHKWMMAPCGAGFLHASGRFKPLLAPLILGWGENEFAVDRADEPMRMAGSVQPFGSTRLQYRIEYQGVDDRSAVLVLPEVVNYLDRLGLDRKWSRERTLANHARAVLADIGLKCVSPTSSDLCGAMTIYELTPTLARQIEADLWPVHRVLCPVTSLGERRFLRVSTAWYNTPAEIDTLGRAVAIIGRGAAEK
jgi:isopenicillin-N epimerase